MRDHDEAGAALGVDAAQERKHFARRSGIEVARGLVGQHQRWLHDQRARNGHALLHTARQLGGAFVDGSGQAHRVQQAACALALGGADAALGHQRRQRDVLQRRKRGQQVVELEDKTQRVASAQRERCVVQALHRLALQQVAARGHGLKQPQDVEQRALARARWPDQRHKLARCHLQVQAVQHFGLAGQAQAVAFSDGTEGNQRGGRGSSGRRTRHSGGGRGKGGGVHGQQSFRAIAAGWRWVAGRAVGSAMVCNRQPGPL